MKRKKIILIIVGVIVVIGITGLYFVSKGGFTKKQRFDNCMESCDELLLTNTFKQYCDEKCAEVTGYEPTAAEVKEIRDKIQAEKTNTNTTTATNTVKNANTTTSTNTNTGTKTNVNISFADYKDREYYCEWSWPQKIIDKNTKEVIQECTSSLPWCYYADYTYENVGCCSDKEHTDCTTLPTFLGDIDPEDREYYCQWVWPQKIIDKNTEEVIKACTYSRPWCYYADYTYENVGCCADQEHTDCITLPNL